MLKKDTEKRDRERREIYYIYNTVDLLLLSLSFLLPTPDILYKYFRIFLSTITSIHGRLSFMA